MRKLFLSIAILIFMISCEKNNTISGLFGTRNNIAYIGRFDRQSGDRAVFMYSGSAIRTNFTGTSVKILLRDDSLRNLFNVIIDGNLTVLKTSDTMEYLLAENLQDKVHSLEIVRRTEWFAGNTTFMGFKLDEGAELMKPDLKPHILEFIGDSYICGYGNEGKSPDEPFKYETENSYMSYGAITSRLLNSEFISVSYSGFGLVQDYNGNKKNALVNHYDRVVNNSSQKWNYSEYKPDAVIVALGGNDVESGVDSALFVSTYVKFLKRVRNNYDNAVIVCVAGPSAPNEYWPLLKAYVKAAAEDFGKTDDKVQYFEFIPFTPHGSNSHPNVAEHKQLADEFTPFLRDVMGW
jgi:lysophospholipase L1-like esterase